EGLIMKKSQSTEFNFSAITKGYGCDLVGEMLARNGANDYMVEIGGEIALAGRNPRDRAWRIMIDAPIDNDSAVVHERMAVIEPGTGGVATSGNYRNYKQTSAGKVWHTISPITGYPAHTDLLSATIIAPNAMLADAYATSCMAMSCDSAIKMLENIPYTEGLLVTLDSLYTPDSAPIYKIRTTKGFPSLIK
ncbi:MAG: FAD:protein FMN transferase, partial [Duncaniella sp.]|nr:FAD:protein FMN transferase [Duncaniella sp.]